MSYLISRNGVQSGPFTEMRLRQMLATGEISPEDLASRVGGTPEWLPLKALLPMPDHAQPPPLTRMPPALPAAGHPPAARRRVWPMVTVVLTLIILAMAAFFWLVNRSVKLVTNLIENDPNMVAQKPLFEERAVHATVWKKSNFEPAGPAQKPPADTLQLVRYSSPAGQLAAYITPDPKDGKKHPAIVWAHGGFGGIDSYFWEPASKRNDQSARAFREAGIVMMMPSWRGENDNPGRFELFYGEVEDMLAAIDHVKKLPWVDPERVYIGGHSTGGTMTLLCAVASDKFRAAFSFGGMPDGVDLLHKQGGYGKEPFDVRMLQDARMRSPVRYVRFIKHPTFYFEGADSYYNRGAADMMDRARKAGAPFTAYKLPGDHFDVLHPTTGLIAQKILSDTGPACGITFTLEELRSAHEAAFSTSLAPTLASWHVHGGNLVKIISDMEADDAIPHTVRDVVAMTSTVKKLAREPFSPVITAQIAKLSALMHSSEGSAWEAVQERFLPEVAGWVERRVATRSPFSNSEADDFLELLETLSRCQDERCTRVIIDAALQGAASEDSGWDAPLTQFDEEHPHTDMLMAALGKKLPLGAIGSALLTAANDAMVAGWKGPHPFDSPQGKAQLRAWLESKDDEDWSSAYSAAFAIEFIAMPGRAELLPLALQHADGDVRLEGAWADLKHHGPHGLAVLKAAALDMLYSKQACEYLRKLDLEEHIPAAALEPEFVAKAEMAAWLRNSIELGMPPLTMKVIDTRELYWPPVEEKRRMWLFEFTFQFGRQAPQKAYGILGSATSWSALSENATPPSPEALYIHHCAAEFARAGRDRLDYKELDEEAARHALTKGNPGMFGP